MRLARDYRLLASSPLFDAEWYLAQNTDVAAAGVDPTFHYLVCGGLEGRQPSSQFDAQQYLIDNPDVKAAKQNALLHFLKYGMREGHGGDTTFHRACVDEPNESFDSAFLQPFYEAAGLSSPPLSVWRELFALGMCVPRTRKLAKRMAALVRQSPLFDAAFYARRLPEGMDPALHYVVVGECLEWKPSEFFDPSFYRSRYEDIKSARVSPLLHYLENGQREGRRPLPAAKRFSFPPLKDRERRPVLLICHEASRTGAPVLGWNLARSLRTKHPIVNLLMRGGALEQDFATDGDAMIGPLTWDEWHPTEIAFIAERLVKVYNPLYAISNSIETCLMVPALAALGVPSVGLVHEFVSYIRPVCKMRSTYDWATHVVFPSKLVAQSSFEVFPSLAKRRGMHVLAQGRQETPVTRETSPSLKTRDLTAIMRPLDAPSAFVVLGVGSVHIRKGVDLFLSAAFAARRLAPDIPFRFVWIGDGYDPENDYAYSIYLHEQIKRSNLEDVVVMLDPVGDLEPAYAACDVFFMSSRLDPQPNVGIDAVTRGIPTICFAGACGTAEILSGDPKTESLVVPHLDLEAAALEICRLAKDRGYLKKMGQAVALVGQRAYDSGFVCCANRSVGMRCRGGVGFKRLGDIDSIWRC